MRSRLDLSLLALACLSAAAFAYTSGYGHPYAACDPEPDEDVDIHFESLQGPIPASEAIDPAKKAEPRSLSTPSSNERAPVEPLASKLAPMDCRVERVNGQTSLSFYCYSQHRDEQFYVRAKLERD